MKKLLLFTEIFSGYDVWEYMQAQKAFIIYGRSLGLRCMTMHSGPGISNRLTVYLTEVTILAKYSDFAEVFWEKSAAMLPKRTDIIEQTIKLQEGKQPL